MIEVLSIVNFDNPKRIGYLERSFKSLHQFNGVDKHIVIDGSQKLEDQKLIYKKFNIEYYFMPSASFSSRLKKGVSLLNSDYFIFVPDDYEWIFNFPVDKAIEQASMHNIKELKLVCPPMQWFSQKKPTIEQWYDENFKLNKIFVPTQSGNIVKRLFWNFHTWITGDEQLVQKDDLFISYRHFRRSFMQQFSLGCHIIETDFMKKLCQEMPDNLLSAGAVEKYIYKMLLFKSYLTGYYKMQTPAFHFIDLDVEGEEKAHIASTNLIERNYKYFYKQEEQK